MAFSCVSNRRVPVCNNGKKKSSLYRRCCSFGLKLTNPLLVASEFILKKAERLFRLPLSGFFDSALFVYLTNRPAAEVASVYRICILAGAHDEEYWQKKGEMSVQIRLP